MANTIRDLVASTVAKYRPGLFYYLADKHGRADLTVDTGQSFIDVTKESEQKKVRINRANAVYVVDMINSFDYYFGSAEPISVRQHNKTYRVVDFSTPRFQRIAGFEDFPVMCPSLTEPFVTAQQYLNFAQIGEGDVVLDLGAYSALTSIAFSKVVGTTGKVVALEPDPMNHEAARTNIAMHRQINKLDNIVLMQAAVSGKRGFIELSSEGAMGSADTSMVGSYRGRAVRVDSYTLDDLVEINRLPKVDFIKMDIEGSEEKAIAASADFFARFKPRIIIEPHVVDKVLSEAALHGLLTDYGYECATIAQTGCDLPLVTGVPRRLN